VTGERRDGGPLDGAAAGDRGSDAPARHVMDPVERTVSRVLIVGITLSVALMAIGIVLGAAGGDGLPSGVVPLADMPSLLLDLDAGAYLSLGLIVLIATPFVRVAGSLVAFALQGDRRYVAVTAVVLTVMCLSVLLGKA
jgi:uncharacterized membrane protein